LDSGRAVTGGYISSDEITDCGCECECDCATAVDPCGEPIEEMPVEHIIDDDCGCDPSVSEAEIPIEAYDEQFLEQTSEATSTDNADAQLEEAIEQINSGHTPRPSLLKRFANWLSVSNHTQS